MRLSRSQIISRRGEDGRMDDDVCQGASGLHPDLCDVTRLQARPGAQSTPDGAQIPSLEPPGKAKRAHAPTILNISNKKTT